MPTPRPPRMKPNVSASLRSHAIGAATVAAIAVALIGGCAGWGRVRAVSANLKKLSPREPLVREWSVTRCYYWIEPAADPETPRDDVAPHAATDACSTGNGATNSSSLVPDTSGRQPSRDNTVSAAPGGTHKKTSGDGDRLCIAMEFENVSLLGDFGKRRLWTSLVLDGLPADRSRNYRADRNTLRMIGRRGYTHTRWASLGGIVAVWRERNGRLRGRFRIAARQQSFFIATGWTGGQRALLLGEFQAVHRPAMGRPILERTERDGMDRTKGVRKIFDGPQRGKTQNSS